MEKKLMDRGFQDPSTHPDINLDKMASFRIDGKQWMVSITPKHVRISCPTLDTTYSIDTSLTPNNLEYDEVEGYTCGMDMTEYIFRGTNNTTMTINWSVPRVDHPDYHILKECASVELSGNGFRSQNPLPVVIARAIPLIVKREYDAMEKLGAYLITRV
jgi:hypothetical protein